MVKIIIIFGNIFILMWKLTGTSISVHDAHQSIVWRFSLLSKPSYVRGGPWPLQFFYEWIPLWIGLKKKVHFFFLPIFFFISPHSHFCSQFYIMGQHFKVLQMSSNSAYIWSMNYKTYVKNISLIRLTV